MPPTVGCTSGRTLPGAMSRFTNSRVRTTDMLRIKTATTHFVVWLSAVLVVGLVLGASAATATPARERGPRFHFDRSAYVGTTRLSHATPKARTGGRTIARAAATQSSNGTAYLLS